MTYKCFVLALHANFAWPGLLLEPDFFPLSHLPITPFASLIFGLLWVPETCARRCG